MRRYRRLRPSLAASGPEICILCDPGHASFVIHVTWSKQIRAYLPDMETGSLQLRKIFRTLCFAAVVLVLGGIYVIAVANAMNFTAG
jgi:hypothetical protein